MQKIRENTLFVYIYCLVVLGLFKLGQNSSDYLISFLYKFIEIPEGDSLSLFFEQLVADLVVVIIMLIVLAITKRIGLLKKKGTGFFKGLPLAAYPLCYCGFVLIVQTYTSINNSYPLNNPITIITFILCMFMVGLSEELCTRTIVAETLLEHYGTSKKGIYMAAIISGILFGCLHLFNLGSESPLTVIVQVIVAGAGGITYAAIYFRSGNIWIPIFIHTLNDIVTGIAYGIFNGGNMGEALAEESGLGALWGLVLVIPEIFVTLHLLRDAKLPEVKERWSEIKD